VRPSTSPDTALPFTVIVTFVISTSLWTSTGSAAEDALDPTLLLARLAVRGSGLLRRLPGRVSGNRGPFDRGLEALEKLVGELLGKAVDDPAAELGELAADMRLDLVAEPRPLRLRRERHLRATLGEARRSALALARDRQRLPRDHVRERDHAGELRLHRADLLHHDRLVARLGRAGQAFAAGDAGLQHLRVENRRPDRLGAGRDVAMVDKLHVGPPSPAGTSLRIRPASGYVTMVVLVISRLPCFPPSPRAAGKVTPGAPAPVRAVRGGPGFPSGARPRPWRRCRPPTRRDRRQAAPAPSPRR